MKRYSAGEIAVATRKGDIGVDTQYIRVDHAIAAGCLIYAPDGDPCKIVSGLLILHKGKLCRTSDRWDEYYEFDVRDDKTHDWVDKLVASTIVQPVRLVPLEDVG